MEQHFLPFPCLGCFPGEHVEAWQRHVSCLFYKSFNSEKFIECQEMMHSNHLCSRFEQGLRIHIDLERMMDLKDLKKKKKKKKSILQRQSRFKGSVNYCAILGGVKRNFTPRYMLCKYLLSFEQTIVISCFKLMKTQSGVGKKKKKKHSDQCLCSIG